MSELASKFIAAVKDCPDETAEVYGLFEGLGHTGIAIRLYSGLENLYILGAHLGPILGYPNLISTYGWDYLVSWDLNSFDHEAQTAIRVYVEQLPNRLERGF
jgi:hypothetical protein